MMRASKCRDMADRYKQKADRLKRWADKCFNDGEIELGAHYERQFEQADKLERLWRQRARQRT